MINQKCPHCDSEKIVKRGHHKGIQRFLCKSCLRTFIETTKIKPQKILLEIEAKDSHKFEFYLKLLTALKTNLNERFSELWKVDLSKITEVAEFLKEEEIRKRCSYVN